MWQFKAQQNEGELREFVNVLRNDNIQSYLEIGSKWGGSLWRVAQILPKGAKIVSVDLPHPSTVQSLDACIDDLRQRGFMAHLFKGDSTSPEIIEQVKALGPFDACLIDANHTTPYVTSDWENYGPLCKIVAFHDISFNRHVPPPRLPIQVKQFWSTLKPKYRRYVEIQHEPADNGFGVLWRDEDDTDDLHMVMGQQVQ